VGIGHELHEKVAKLNGYNQWNQKFCIRQSSNQQLFLMFADGAELGYLSEKMIRAVENLINLPRFELEAFTNPGIIIDAIRRARKTSDAVIRVNINFYGLNSYRDQVGKELSDKGLFLQLPDVGVRRPGIMYDNPHILRLDGMDETDTEVEEDADGLRQVDSPEESEEEFQDTITEVFSALRRGEGLKRLEGSENLKKALFP
jgi:hypothetical protein